MRLITQIFKNRQEKDQINKMLVVAVHEKALQREEIDLLSKDIDFISYKELTSEERIKSFKKALPKEAKEKFKVAYLLVSSSMKSKASEEVLCNLVQVMDVPKEKARELVTYLKSNILNGLNMEDSFMRLGYLLIKPTTA